MIYFRHAFSALFAGIVFLAAHTAQTTTADAGTVRVLLIGNGKYASFPNAKLDLTANDVAELATGLTDVNKAAQERGEKGEIVTTQQLNLGLKAMRDAWNEHLKSLQDGDTSIFVYSGHGTEIEGHSYLLPTDIKTDLKMNDTASLNAAAVGLTSLLEDFYKSTRGRQINVAGVFVIDACRDSRPLRIGRVTTAPPQPQQGGAGVGQAPPMPVALADPDGGIAAVSTPQGMVVLYSAASRQVAIEKLSNNDPATTSLYVRKLVELFRDKDKNVLNLSVEQLAKQVRWNVYVTARDVAGMTQTPAYIDEMLEHRNVLGRTLETVTQPQPVVSVKRFAPGEAHTKGLGLPAIIKDCDQCPELVELPTGNFVIGTAAGSGDDSERPATKVAIQHRFALGRFEISRGQWLACQTDKERGKCRDLVKPRELGRELRQPIADVRFEDAQAYVDWLNKLVEPKGKQFARYRLPSEAEWEYGARAGSTAAYSFGDDPADLCRHANGADASLKAFAWANTLCKDGHGRETAQIDSYLPNAFGLHNMHGNVWEWTADCWAATHDGIDTTGKPRATGDCTSRVVRGGSWRSAPEALRSAKRIGLPATHTRGTLGFRVALDLDEAK